MKVLSFLLFVSLGLICSAQSAAEALGIPRPPIVEALRVTPNVQVSFPVATGGREKATIDFSDFVRREAAWKDGEEAVVRIDARFGFENVWFRDWLHFSVIVFVGDGTFELPFEVKGTISAGRKGLRSDNAILKERLALAVAPAFSKAVNYLRSAERTDQ